MVLGHVEICENICITLDYNAVLTGPTGKFNPESTERLIAESASVEYRCENPAILEDSLGAYADVVCLVSASSRQM